MGKYLKDKAWWAGNKLITPVTTLAGIGAAGGVDDGSPMLAYAMKGAANFPYKIAADIATDEGIIGDVSRMFIDLADNVIEHPYATLGSIGAGILTGKVVQGVSEHKRLKKKYGGS